MKNYRKTFITLCILLSCAFSILPVNGMNLQPADTLYSIIQRRVDLMQWVALDKWKNHKPIEDIPREKIVIEKTRKQAADAGIINIDDLTRAQIQIAKNEQQRWMEKWKKTQLSADSNTPSLSELRTELDSLSSELIISLKDTLPSLRETKYRTKLRKMLDKKLKKLPSTERQMLWNGLLQMRELADKESYR